MQLFFWFKYKSIMPTAWEPIALFGNVLKDGSKNSFKIQISKYFWEQKLCLQILNVLYLLCPQIFFENNFYL